MKRIWVNGTFDILHIGHIRLLTYAASLGKLRVGLDTDRRVKEKKGFKRPFNSLDIRMEFISSIRGIDSVVFFDTDDQLIDNIKSWKTDILVVGSDYSIDDVMGKDCVNKILFFDKIENISTTKILNYG